MSKTLDEPLICDVMLPPATIIKRGCDLRTLLVAISQRGNLPPSQRVLRDAEQQDTVMVPRELLRRVVTEPLSIGLEREIRALLGKEGDA